MKTIVLNDGFILQADTDVEIDVQSMLPENPEKEMQELNISNILSFCYLVI